MDGLVGARKLDRNRYIVSAIECKKPTFSVSHKYDNDWLHRDTDSSQLPVFGERADNRDALTTDILFVKGVFPTNQVVTSSMFPDMRKQFVHFKMKYTYSVKGRVNPGF